jgi:hypothetical protein
MPKFIFRSRAGVQSQAGILSSVCSSAFYIFSSCLVLYGLLTNELNPSRLYALIYELYILIVSALRAALCPSVRCDGSKV